LGSDVFKYTKIDTIYVPTASVGVYKYTSGWSSYKNNIVGYNF
jgi:hypothetical protein